MILESIQQQVVAWDNLVANKYHLCRSLGGAGTSTIGRRLLMEHQDILEDLLRSTAYISSRIIPLMTRLLKGGDGRSLQALVESVRLSEAQCRRHASLFFGRHVPCAASGGNTRFGALALHLDMPVVPPPPGVNDLLVNFVRHADFTIPSFSHFLQKLREQYDQLPHPCLDVISSLFQGANSRASSPSIMRSLASSILVHRNGHTPIGKQGEKNVFGSTKETSTAFDMSSHLRCLPYYTTSVFSSLCFNGLQTCSRGTSNQPRFPRSHFASFLTPLSMWLHLQKYGTIHAQHADSWLRPHGADGLNQSASADGGSGVRGHGSPCTGVLSHNDKTQNIYDELSGLMASPTVAFPDNS